MTFIASSMHRNFVAALAGALDWLDSKPDVSVVIFTGTKNTFMAGAEIRELRDLNSDAAVQDFLRIPHQLMTRIYKMEKVVIAAINGYCLGGGLELALACDIRIAANDLKDSSGNDLAYLGFPEIKLGLVPALGGVSTLVATIGRARAVDFLYSGSLVTASRAREVGLVDFVVSRAHLMEEAQARAQEIQANSPASMQSLKRLLQSSLISEYADTLRQSRDEFAHCCVLGDKNQRIEESRQLRLSNFRQTLTTKNQTTEHH